MTKWIFAVINTICLIIIVLFTSIEIPTFNYAFYNYEYNKNGTYETIGISQYDLERVTYKLMYYIKGDVENLEVHADINGEGREFFNDLEKAHMVDVKQLFQIGYAVRNIAVVVFFITYLCAFVYKRRPALREYAKSFIGLTLVFITACGGLVLIIFSNFNKYFTIFHEIFFDNDMWILDPATDLLINIVPLPFFIDIFKVVILLFFLAILIMMIISIVYLKSGNNKQEVRE